MESFSRKIEPIVQETSPITSEDVRIEKEFKQDLFLDLGEENLEYAMIRSRENSEQMDNWIVFIGGFATTKEQYRGEIVNLVKMGKSVIFVNPDKGITPTEEDIEYFYRAKDVLPSSIAQKATAVLALLKHLNIHQVDIIGNSQGAAVAAGLVGAHPEIAKRLILDCPVGLSGKDSVFGLLRRTTKDANIQRRERKKYKHLIDSTLHDYDEDVWKEYWKKLKKHRTWRLTKEMPDIIKIDLRPILKKLKTDRQDSNIGPEIILFNAHSDAILLAEKIEETLGDDPLQFVDRWAMYANKEKKHSKYTQPQPNITPEDYFSSRDSALHQLFSLDIQAQG